MVESFRTSQRRDVSQPRSALYSAYKACQIAYRLARIAYGEIFLWHPQRVAGEGPPPKTARLLGCTAEACKGLFYASDGGCMVCGTAHCVQCAAPTGPDHACERGAAASLRAVLTQSQSCPRCHACIVRSGGCDQMMCTLCNCVFSFQTGAEERGVVHNPYFFHLAAELRQQVVRDRAERGLTTRLLGEAAACDHDGVHDPLCLDFASPLFLDLLEREHLLNEPVTQTCKVRGLYQHILHVERTVLANDDVNERFGERIARKSRVCFVRGRTLPHFRTGLAQDEFSNVTKHWDLLVLARVQPARFSACAHAKNLMRFDTAKKKELHRFELEATYVAACKDLMRLMLAATPAERPSVLKQLAEIKGVRDAEVGKLDHR